MRTTTLSIDFLTVPEVPTVCGISAAGGLRASHIPHPLKSPTTSDSPAERTARHAREVGMVRASLDFSATPGWFRVAVRLG
jgi:hypothetical protein